MTSAQQPRTPPPDEPPATPPDAAGQQLLEAAPALPYDSTSASSSSPNSSSSPSPSPAFQNRKHHPCLVVSLILTSESHALTAAHPSTHHGHASRWQGGLLVSTCAGRPRGPAQRIPRQGPRDRRWLASSYCRCPHRDCPVSASSLQTTHCY